MTKKMAVTFPTELDITQEADVLVIGGGPGGLGAAVSAAREGLDVLLVEHYGFLGGMASAGEVNPFMPNHANGKSLDQGIFTEWRDKINAYNNSDSENALAVLDPASASLAAEDLCLEAGVRLLFHHRAVQVEQNKRNIQAVVLHSKSGFSLAKAKIYIDATGDGDLAALAGNSFEIGGETGQNVQPMTLCFKLKIDEKDLPEGEKITSEKSARAFAAEINSDIQEAYKKAQKEGRVKCLRQNVLMFKGTDSRTIHFNTTRVINKLAINGKELSEAEIEGREQIRQYVALLRRDIPLFKHCKIHSIATQIGVRESRRILGRNYLVRKDFTNASKCEDNIARVNYPIDIHSTTGEGTEITRLAKEDDWYDIPYGCIVPKDVDNLLMACRAISVDHAIHASMRIMPPVVSIGQAAGLAASLAIKNNLAVADIESKELKSELEKRGRNLTE